jgi:hypothetical protein
LPARLCNHVVAEPFSPCAFGAIRAKGQAGVRDAVSERCRPKHTHPVSALAQAFPERDQRRHVAASRPCNKQEVAARIHDCD